MTTYDARTLARAWLSVAVASGKDDTSPAIDRTVLIEAFPEGVRLVATDRYMLLHAWAPNVDHDLDPAPGIDDAPYASAVAMDTDGRAAGFLAYALRRATGDDAPEVLVRLKLGVVDEVVDPDRPAFAGFECRYVILEMADVERVKLRTFEGPFPAWRPIMAGLRPRRTVQVALGAEVLGRLAKLGKVHGDRPLGWTFGGPDKPAHLTVLDSDPAVEGAVMPVRWDMVNNRPDVPDRDDSDSSAERSVA